MNARPNSVKLWPHLTLVFLVCAALGGVAAALWMRHEPKVEALAVPRAARAARVDGEVGLSRNLAADADDEANWVELTPNTPLTTGDRLYARDESRAALAFTGRNFATIDPDSSLDVVSLSDRRTQLALREGSAIFEIGELAPDEMFEVATPYGAVDFQEPGLYQVGYNDDGSASVSVLSGLAQVVGLAGSGQISKGDGNWMLDDSYGLTWVSNEPWGYAPYHYGRWVNAGERWYWVPDAANTQPAYAPALVAFLPATGAEQIGWVPLAPGEQHAPAHYDSNWQPRYYGGNYDAPERVANLGVPGGVTVVSYEDFGRPFDRRSVERFDPRAFDGVRPLSDPLSHARLRQMSLTRANERRGFTLPPGLAKRLDDTRVYASAPPPRFRDGRNDVARRFRVESVPEKQKREKMKFDDRRQEPAQASVPARRFEESRRRGRDNKREEKAVERAARGRGSWSPP